MKSLSKAELKELLNKGWMTHDGMWFFHCLQECGIETTNKINRAAVRSMSMIEAKRVAKAVGLKQVRTFEEFKSFLSGMFDVVKADFMNFDFSLTPPGKFHMEMHQCFARDGIEKMGVLEQYECGLFDRIEGWLKSLEIDYSVTPQVKTCMMLTDGECFRNFELHFEEGGSPNRSG